MNFVICAGTIVRSGEYVWAAGFVAVAVVFSPLFLVAKIFFLLSGATITSLLVLCATLRPQPVAVV